MVRPAALARGRCAHVHRHDGEDLDNLFGAIDSLRIPVEYLAELFTAGDPAPVRRVLQRLSAMRSYMRAVNLGDPADETVAAPLPA